MSHWVLLRGLTRESRHWGHFVWQFQQMFPGDLVATPDLPGNGRLNHQRSPSRVTDMVEDCRAQLLRLNLNPPYRLLAMSLGAMVTLAWSHAYPDEVTAQVLINTSMRPFNPFYQRLQSANYATLLQLAFTSATPEAWERAILRLTSNRGDASVLPFWLQLRRENPVARTNALRQLLAAARYRAPAGPPTCPTLLLASQRDQLVSVNCSQSLAQHWQCPLRLHPTAGHDIPLDDGSWVAQQVHDWLTKPLVADAGQDETTQRRPS